jgi:hypothetical protein
MLWNERTVYREEPFETEADFEEAILKVAPALFGDARLYLDVERLIGARGRTRDIPDGYLIDLASIRDPKLFVVENELGKHEPLRHVAVQILEFSLSFESSPHSVKGIVRDALAQRPDFLLRGQEYARRNGFENVDLLLERMIHGSNRFNTFVVIDELDEEHHRNWTPS